MFQRRLSPCSLIENYFELSLNKQQYFFMKNSRRQVKQSNFTILSHPQSKNIIVLNFHSSISQLAIISKLLLRIQLKKRGERSIKQIGQDYPNLSTVASQVVLQTEKEKNFISYFLKQQILLKSMHMKQVQSPKEINLNKRSSSLQQAHCQVDFYPLKRDEYNLYPVCHWIDDHHCDLPIESQQFKRCSDIQKLEGKDSPIDRIDRYHYGSISVILRVEWPMKINQIKQPIPKNIAVSNPFQKILKNKNRNLHQYVFDEQRIISQKPDISEKCSYEVRQMLIEWELRVQSKHVDLFLCQSKHIEFDMENTKKQCFQTFSQKTIRRINKAMIKYNLMGLKVFECSQFHNFFQDLSKNWDIYQSSYFQTINKFIRINQYKRIVYKKAYDLVYPYMPKLLIQLRAKLKIESLQQIISRQKLKKSQPSEQWNHFQIDFNPDSLTRIKKELQIEDHISDKILQHFIEEQDPNRKNQGAIYIKVEGNDKVPLKEFVSEYQDFKPFGWLWQSLFNSYRFEAQLEYYDFSGTKDRTKITRMKNFTKEAHLERMVECGCLGCSSFFYYGNNVADEIINKTPVISMPEISKMKDYQSRIKDEICSLLNCGGGVMLFGTKQQYKNIITYGECITEKDKEEYEQRIYSYLEGFYPRPQTKKNVFISFVPVVADPNSKDHLSRKIPFTGVQGMAKKHQFYHQREYIEGLYIARIRVCPTEGTHVYYWSSEQGQFYSSIRKRGKRVEIKMSDLPTLMKQKFNRFYVPENYESQQMNMLRKPVNYFNHECTIAEIGIPIRTRLDGVVRSGSKNLQNEYGFMTMIIAKKNDLDDIKRKFKAKSVSCEIEYRFHSYKFKPAHNTAILYHSIRFEELLKIISTNQEFMYNGRPLMAINITGYIKLQNRHSRNKLSLEDFINLKAWLKVEFPQDELRLWEFDIIGNQKEYFIQTDTKLSTQFMYFVLNHYSEKATFKNPQGLDKMSQQQRDKRWRQISNNINYAISESRNIRFYKIGELNNNRTLSENEQAEKIIEAQNQYLDKYSYEIDNKYFTVLTTKSMIQYPFTGRSKQSEILQQSIEQDFEASLELYQEQAYSHFDQEQKRLTDIQEYQVSYAQSCITDAPIPSDSQKMCSLQQIQEQINASFHSQLIQFSQSDLASNNCNSEIDAMQFSLISDEQIDGIEENKPINQISHQSDSNYTCDEVHKSIRVGDNKQDYKYMLIRQTPRQREQKTTQQLYDLYIFFNSIVHKVISLLSEGQQSNNMIWSKRESKINDNALPQNCKSSKYNNWQNQYRRDEDQDNGNGQAEDLGEQLRRINQVY